MGREFDSFFDEWATTYDETVHGSDEQYKEVFLNYENILKTVAAKVSGTVVEFGTGTGNLARLLLKQGATVIGIEPSKNMREQARQKVPDLTILDGDFLDFILPIESVDAFVSSYAFHHLTDQEKQLAISRYSTILPKGGKIVFADTIYDDDSSKQAIIEMAQAKEFNRLVADLTSEYYTTIDFLKRTFELNQFNVTFKRMNTFVQIVEAIKN